jgi:hypothetical protein
MNAPSAGFAVAPLTPGVGGLVTGLDLARPLSDAVVAKLKAALAERHVLFSKGKRWTRLLSAISPRASASFTFTPSIRMSMASPRSLPSRRALTICQTTTIGTPTSPSSRRRLSAPF